MLREAEGRHDRPIEALVAYAAGRDKSPVAGGVLGLIPGLGYLYAGEPGNALRSFLLNGLFLFGMAHTADNEQWGAFAAITFFELTWYSGSIYGGMDAAHRYNRQRAADTVAEVLRDSDYQPDWSALPLVRLQFGF